MPYPNDIRIGIIVYTLYYIFYNFTVTSVTFGLKLLIYNVLSGDRRGDRRVTEVAVNGIFMAKNCIFRIFFVTLQRNNHQNYTKNIRNMIKITRIKANSNGKMSVTHWKMAKMIEKIMADDSKSSVTQFRNYAIFTRNRIGQGGRWLGKYDKMNTLPSFLPSVEIIIDEDGNEIMKAFNGIITLSVDNITEATELEAIKKVASLMPMTLAAFVSSTGSGVKILVRVEPTDGHIVTTKEEAEQVCRTAYDIAVKVYGGIINHNVQMAVSAREGQCLYAGFRLSLDPTPYFNPDASPIKVANIIQSYDNCLVSTLHDSHLTDNKPSDIEDPSDIRMMIDYLKSKYVFRFNRVENVAEMKILNKQNYGWLPLDDKRFNSILLDIQSRGLRIWDKDFNRYLHSTKVNVYDPVQDYLYGLEKKWDGKDHIGRLANCVHTDCKQWKRWFRKWFLSMVAQWIGKDRRYGNSVAPLLISPQGYNKSTFCRRLLPPEFKQTFIDNLDIAEKKTTLIAMAQSLLINLDEFNAIPPRIQQGFLKNVMQLPTIKVKLPYARSIEEIPRRASFIATTNMCDILADPSGCRRFIGIELTSPIDVTCPINYEQLYAQAMHAIMNGERYWFDYDENEEIIEHNRQYQLLSPAEQYFRLCFSVTQDESVGQYMTTAAIYDKIKSMAGSSLGVNGLSKFGQFLANLDGIVRKRTKIGTAYLVKPLPSNN